MVQMAAAIPILLFEECGMDGTPSSAASPVMHSTSPVPPQITGSGWTICTALWTRKNRLLHATSLSPIGE